ncbi:hypothetical protein TTHERM_000904049 (macronuclear) [Tetrahymena thermophila SB210]|uniref:Uncharacterized protein n=1 Tax=Tetrahymena thermophila (strain SB210) TaxID=312017 RepID=W7WZZ9_TETTS|nr:hypothetical protein TTHERM_000904049 [Tetrahymena thermophila SB210]EWS71192.1 hypothetical protein TTHERM_000904049 [Tetrahymena thermophila SB210]|eukprot:XP_012656290.1 hypothetical protein TTHERM_000904049 [Tetrahymena thermophila SB210]
MQSKYCKQSIQCLQITLILKAKSKYLKLITLIIISKNSKKKIIFKIKITRFQIIQQNNSLFAMNNQQNQSIKINGNYMISCQISKNLKIKLILLNYRKICLQILINLNNKLRRISFN